VPASASQPGVAPLPRQQLRDRSLAVVYSLCHAFAAATCMQSLTMQAQALALSQLPGVAGGASTGGVDAAASASTLSSSSVVLLPSDSSNPHGGHPLMLARGRGAGAAAQATPQPHGGAWGGGRLRVRALPDSHRLLLGLWPWGGLRDGPVPAPDGAPARLASYSDLASGGGGIIGARQGLVNTQHLHPGASG
jgi:hypothetical protein